MRQRQQLAPLFWQIYLSFWLLGLFFPLWPVPILVFAMLPIFIGGRAWSLPRLILAFFVFCLGFACAEHSLHKAEKAVAESPAWIGHTNHSEPARVCGDIENVQLMPENRARILLKNVAPASAPHEKPLPGLCLWTWDEPAAPMPLAGQKACVARSIRPADSFANGIQTDFLPAFYAKGVYWRLWSKAQAGNPQFFGTPFFSSLRAKLRSKFIAALRASEPLNSPLPQARAILLALVFGDKSALNIETVNLFSSSALAHSLALSGQHLGIAVLLAFLLVSFFGRIQPVIFLIKPRRVLIAIVAIPPALVYLWLGNMPPSLIRAGGMLLVFTWLLFRGAAFNGLDALCATLVLILLADPLAVYDIGLQFSALCVCILILGAPFASRIKISGNIPGSSVAQAFLRIILLSFLIQLALLPLSLARFHIAGYWFPLNAIWLPLLAFWTLPLAASGLILACFWTAGAGLALDLASIPCQLILSLLEYLNITGLLMEPSFLSPHWTTILAFAILAIALAGVFGGSAIQKRKARNLLFAALGLLCVGPILREIAWHNQDITLEALDVGQGQALLLRFPGSGKILIDGGGSNSRRFDPGKAVVGPVLNNNSRPVVEAVINSHPDLDHMGGLFHILDKFSSPVLFHNGRKGNSTWQKDWEKAQSSHDSHVLAKGDVIEIGAPELGLKLEVLHPPRDAEKLWQGNSASLVLRLVKNGGGLALLTGDAEKSTLKHLASSGQDLRAKVIIAPHHGSDRSLWPNFYQLAEPELVAASCGYLNRYNYPGRKLANFLAKNRIPLLDTGNNGRISFKFGDILGVGIEKGKMPALISGS